MKFSGVYTAIVTPFLEDGKIDYASFENLIEHQINGGVSGIVFLGSTGERGTLISQEINDVFKFASKFVNNRVQIIANTGTMSTAESIENSKTAENIGYDGLLLVNPYYNKPTQEGMYLHFSEIAKNTNTPIILYNIKGRTGVNLETDTLMRLSEIKNIIAVKESSGDLAQIMDVVSRVPENFSVLSGDDPLTYPMMMLGAHGCISVISNAFPKYVNDIYNKSLSYHQEARKMHYDILKLVNTMFALTTNPIGIKEVLQRMNLIKSNNVRLPLCKMNSDLAFDLKNVLEDFLCKIER
jgi:4-hydroxy-tetrahydrodipicolinate synthase